MQVTLDNVIDLLEEPSREGQLAQRPCSGMKLAHLRNSKKVGVTGVL